MRILLVEDEMKLAHAMKRALEDGAARLGIPVLQLGSPASHDAAAFGAAGVAHSKRGLQSAIVLPVWDVRNDVLGRRE